MVASPDPFSARDTLATGEQFYRIDALGDPLRLPYTICVLLENLLRRAGSEHVSEADVAVAGVVAGGGRGLEPRVHAGPRDHAGPDRRAGRRRPGRDARRGGAGGRRPRARGSAGAGRPGRRPLGAGGRVRLRPGLRAQHRARVRAQRRALRAAALGAGRLPQLPGGAARHGHRAPGQPRVPGPRGAGARRRGHARLAGRHRLAHHHDQRAGRAGMGRRRDRGGGRDAGTAAVHAVAGGAGRAHVGRAGRGRHRHRPGADADRAAARTRRGRQVRRVLRAGRAGPDRRRPRDHLQHVAGVRLDRRHVPGRPPHDRLPARHRPRRGPAAAGGELLQGAGALPHRRGGRARVLGDDRLRPDPGRAEPGRPAPAAGPRVAADAFRRASPTRSLSRMATAPSWATGRSRSPRSPAARTRPTRR